MLYDLIQQIASYYPMGPVRDRYMEAAKDFRIPYWDWAVAAPVGQSVLPTSVQSPGVAVDGPVGTQTILNPLFSYKFDPFNTTELPDFPVCCLSI